MLQMFAMDVKAAAGNVISPGWPERFSGKHVLEGNQQHLEHSCHIRRSLLPQDADLRLRVQDLTKTQATELIRRLGL